MVHPVVPSNPSLRSPTPGIFCFASILLGFAAHISMVPEMPLDGIDSPPFIWTDSIFASAAFPPMASTYFSMTFSAAGRSAAGFACGAGAGAVAVCADNGAANARVQTTARARPGRQIKPNMLECSWWGPGGAKGRTDSKCTLDLMLKGTKDALVQKIQPVSIHGQISLDVYFVDPDDSQGQVSLARIGPESVPRDMEPGDRVTLHYMLGVVTSITKPAA